MYFVSTLSVNIYFNTECRLFILVEMQHVVLYYDSSLATSYRDSFFTVISMKRIEVLLTSTPVASKIASNENLTFFHNCPSFRISVRRSRKTAYIFLRPQTLHRNKYTARVTNSGISLNSFLCTAIIL